MLKDDCAVIVNIKRNCPRSRKVSCEYLVCNYIYFLNAVSGAQHFLLNTTNHNLFHHSFFEHMYIFTLAF